MPPYSYRTDPTAPAFPGDRPLFVFDGVCVLCSTGARWLIRHDRTEKFRFAAAQSDLGRALYAHYGIDFNDTYLLLAAGVPHVKSDGYLEVCRHLGGPWRLLLVLKLIPRPLRDAIYDLVARNRYRWFGTTEYCALLTEDVRTRVLT